MASPQIDNRTYQQLIDDARSRIKVHTPEWTNVSESDPGISLIELFAFLTESLLYRANLIPERNRQKFLSLLNIPRRAAASSLGIVQFSTKLSNAKLLPSDTELRAENIPFRTEHAIEVVPIKGVPFYKKAKSENDQEIIAYYNQLYSALNDEPAATNLTLYETTAFPHSDGSVLDLSNDTIDAKVWIALVADSPENVAAVREELKNKVISIGILPAINRDGIDLLPGMQPGSDPSALFKCELPDVQPLPEEPNKRRPSYKIVPSRMDGDLLQGPAVAHVSLGDTLSTWGEELEPLESGTGDFPPALADTALEGKIVTWLRITLPYSRCAWIGVNAAHISQRARVINELLARGTGEPDQKIALANKSIIEDSLSLTVSETPWERIDDIAAAGPEVRVNDRRLPQYSQFINNANAQVYTVDCAAGEIRFGDGLRGMRPPENAIIRTDYDYSSGSKGNVGIDAIKSGIGLPEGITVTNPIATWGGVDAESVAEAEKQISRYLQHKERLVTAEDFVTIVKRTPGVEIGRVEAIAAYNPQLRPNIPGDAPGAVTVMVIPQNDAKHPLAPVPDTKFLDTICSHIDQRRLITTEIFLRGPVYKKIWVSVGIDPVYMAKGKVVNQAEVCAEVKSAIERFLSPLPPDPGTEEEDSTENTGWPLRKAVVQVHLLTAISRVKGVASVRDLQLADDAGEKVQQVPMEGLELPMLAGISVTVGAAVPIEQLIGTPSSTAETGEDGQTGETTGEGKPSIIPVPVIPEGCK